LRARASLRARIFTQYTPEFHSAGYFFSVLNKPLTLPHNKELKALKKSEAERKKERRSQEEMRT
jgi:hypothetical protein